MHHNHRLVSVMLSIGETCCLIVFVLAVLLYAVLVCGGIA